MERVLRHLLLVVVATALCLGTVSATSEQDCDYCRSVLQTLDLNRRNADSKDFSVLPPKARLTCSHSDGQAKLELKITPEEVFPYYVSEQEMKVFQDSRDWLQKQLNGSTTCTSRVETFKLRLCDLMANEPAQYCYVQEPTSELYSCRDIGWCSWHRKYTPDWGHQEDFTCTPGGVFHSGANAHDYRMKLERQEAEAISAEIYILQHEKAIALENLKRLVARQKAVGAPSQPHDTVKRSRHAGDEGSHQISLDDSQETSGGFVLPGRTVGDSETEMLDDVEEFLKGRLVNGDQQTASKSKGSDDGLPSFVRDKLVGGSTKHDDSGDSDSDIPSFVKAKLVDGNAKRTDDPNDDLPSFVRDKLVGGSTKHDDSGDSESDGRLSPATKSSGAGDTDNTFPFLQGGLAGIGGIGKWIRGSGEEINPGGEWDNVPSLDSGSATFVGIDLPERVAVDSVGDSSSDASFLPSWVLKKMHKSQGQSTRSAEQVINDALSDIGLGLEKLLTDPTISQQIYEKLSLPVYMDDAYKDYATLAIALRAAEAARASHVPHDTVRETEEWMLNAQQKQIPQVIEDVKKLVKDAGNPNELGGGSFPVSVVIDSINKGDFGDFARQPIGDCYSPSYTRVLVSTESKLSWLEYVLEVKGYIKGWRELYERLTDATPDDSSVDSIDSAGGDGLLPPPTLNDGMGDDFENLVVPPSFDGGDGQQQVPLTVGADDDLASTVKAGSLPATRKEDQIPATLNSDPIPLTVNADDLPATVNSDEIPSMHRAEKPPVTLKVRPGDVRLSSRSDNPGQLSRGCTEKKPVAEPDREDKKPDTISQSSDDSVGKLRPLTGTDLEMLQLSADVASSPSSDSNSDSEASSSPPSSEVSETLSSTLPQDASESSESGAGVNQILQDTLKAGNSADDSSSGEQSRDKDDSDAAVKAPSKSHTKSREESTVKAASRKRIAQSSEEDDSGNDRIRSWLDKTSAQPDQVPEPEIERDMEPVRELNSDVKGDDGSYFVPQVQNSRFNLLEHHKNLGCKGLESGDQGRCGLCWAFALAQTMSTRLCIQSKGKFNVRVSPADLAATVSPRLRSVYMREGDGMTTSVAVASLIAHLNDGGEGFHSEACRPYSCSNDEAAVRTKALGKQNARTAAHKMLSKLRAKKSSGSSHAYELVPTDPVADGKCSNACRFKVQPGSIRLLSLRDIMFFTQSSSNPDLDVIRLDVISPSSSDEALARLTKLIRTLKHELVTKGPVAVAIDAKFLRPSGFHAHFIPNSRVLSHMVTVVGWDDQDWLIQNSWGEMSTKDGGLYRIRMDRVPISSDNEWLAADLEAPSSDCRVV